MSCPRPVPVCRWEDSSPPSRQGPRTVLSRGLYPRQGAAKASGEDTAGHGIECEKVEGLRKLMGQIRFFMSEKPSPRA